MHNTSVLHADQIWVKSRCRDIENATKLRFRQSNVPVWLVDAVNVSTLNGTIVTDNIVSRPHIGLYPEFWGSYSYEPEYINRSPSRLFNCFMNRICITRQSWFYQFVRRDLLNEGSISFLLDYRQLPLNVDTKQDLNEYIFNQGNSIFEPEHARMRDQVPFCNFEGDLDQVIVDSRISLVIETYFDWPDTITFSEKVFRALQLPRPMILYNMPGSVGVLRNYGFDVWDDIIDHSYDGDSNQIQRQIQILDQLCNLRDIRYTDNQLNEFETRANHNRMLLKNLRLQWPEKLKNVLAQLQK